MLAKSACVSTACTYAKVSRMRAYRHRERFPKFRAAWDEALVVSTEVLEVEARQRALDRSDPASSRLLTLLLQAHSPKFRPDTKQNVSIATNVSAPAVSVYLPENGRGDPQAKQ